VNNHHQSIHVPLSDAAAAAAASASAAAGTSSEDSDTEELASPIDGVVDHHHQPTAHLPSPPRRVDIEEESRSSATGELDPSIRSVFVAASDDFGPMGGGQSLQQQTTDQDSGLASSTGAQFSSSQQQPQQQRPQTSQNVVVVGEPSASVAPHHPTAATAAATAAETASSAAVVAASTSSVHHHHRHQEYNILPGLPASSEGLINLEPLGSPDYTYSYDDHENLNDFFDDLLYTNN